MTRAPTGPPGPSDPEPGSAADPQPPAELTPEEADALIEQARSGRLTGQDPLSQLLRAAISAPESARGEEAAVAAFRAARRERLRERRQWSRIVSWLRNRGGALAIALLGLGALAGVAAAAERHGLPVRLPFAHSATRPSAPGDASPPTSPAPPQQATDYTLREPAPPATRSAGPQGSSRGRTATQPAATPAEPGDDTGKGNGEGEGNGNGNSKGRANGSGEGKGTAKAHAAAHAASPTTPARASSAHPDADPKPPKSPKARPSRVIAGASKFHGRPLADPEGPGLS
ncbi:hypothetical protein [Phaeacidiphilus oryzae]|uniref:hypothetical protein n=1 Tax=Phaeacidiphilus oryzae TaxID=348818 RepID=UPI00056BB64B|nr:hypothetical protein [Phaeacidiphilus oryzae]